MDERQEEVYAGSQVTSSVEVYGFDGTLKRTFTELPGAGGTALSADGSDLYVALGDADAVVALDPATGAEQARWATGPCPTWLARTPAALWVAVGCEGQPGSIEVIDPSSRPDATAVDGAFDQAVTRLRASGDGTVLVALSGTTLATWDVRGTQLARRARGDVPGATAACEDVDLTADGSDAYLTCSQLRGLRVRTADLSSHGEFPQGYLGAIAVAPTGVVATAEMWDGRFALTGAEGTWFGRTASVPGFPVRRGSAWSADGRRLFALYASDGPTPRPRTIDVPPPTDPLAGTDELRLTQDDDITVDDTRQEVFVSTGLDGAEVRAFGTDGRHHRTFTELANASGMAMSADGASLYVALTGNDAVVALDPTTGAEQRRWATPRGTCPRRLARTGTVLWVLASGCATAATRVLAIDTAAGDAAAIAVTAGLDGTRVAAWRSSVDGSTLAAVQGRTIFNWDVSGTTLSLRSVKVDTDWCTGLALSADGSHEYAVCDGDVLRYPTAEGPGTPVPNDGQYANAVAVSSTGMWALVDNSRVRVLDATGRFVSGRYLLRDGGSWLPQTSTWTADGRLIGLAQGPSSLHLSSLSGLDKYELTTTWSTAELTTVDTTVNVRARITAGAAEGYPADVPVAVRIKDDLGVHELPPVRTAAGGIVAFPTSFPNSGENELILVVPPFGKFQGGTSSNRVWVDKLNPNVWFGASTKIVPLGGHFTLGARLMTTGGGNRTLTVRIAPWGPGTATTRTVTVDAKGWMNLVTTPSRSMIYTVSFTGDRRYVGAVYRVFVEVRPPTYLTLYGYRARDRGVALYSRGATAQLRFTVPVTVPGDVIFEAEVLSRGRWVDYGTTAMVPVQGRQAWAKLGGRFPRGTTFRVRTSYYPDRHSYIGGNGAWTTLRFS